MPERQVEVMRAKNMALCALFAAMMAVCAWIAVPVGGVTFTLQTLALFLCLQLMGGKWGTAACLVYLALGAAGLPVFAGFRGGLGALLDPTGGFLLGFLGLSLCYWALTALFGKGVSAAALGLGLAVCYAFGTGWFLLFHAGENTPLGAVLMTCVVPYLVPDAVKLGLSLILARRLRRFLV